MLHPEFMVLIKQHGAQLYEGFDANERLLVSFGMAPRFKVETKGAWLFLQFLEAEGRAPTADEQSEITRALIVAILGAANAGPDTVVV